MLVGFRYSSRIEEFAANCVLGQQTHPDAAVVLIVQEFPEATGLDVIFALVSLATSIEEWAPKGAFEKELPNMLYKTCSILGADLFALEKQGKAPASCRAISEYWGGDELYFNLSRSTIKRP